MLDLEYVQLNVTKVLALFNKVCSNLNSRTRLIYSYSQNGDRVKQLIKEDDVFWSDA